MREAYLYDPLNRDSGTNARTWMLARFELEFDPSDRMIQELNYRHRYDGVSFRRDRVKIVTVSVMNCDKEKFEKVAQELSELEEQVLEALRLQKLAGFAQ